MQIGYSLSQEGMAPCVARTGCMPSKLLIAAADAAHNIDQASVFGIEVKGKTVDSHSVFERVRKERDRFAGFVVKSTEARPEEFRIQGHAKFIGQKYSTSR